VGINIASNNAMTAITTKSSISVKPFILRMTDHSPFSVREGFFLINVLSQHGAISSLNQSEILYHSERGSATFFSKEVYKILNTAKKSKESHQH
jgi:hypothetical protein